MIPTTTPATSPRHSLNGEALSSAKLPVESVYDGENTEIVIKPQSGWIPINWKELYAYRELLLFFVWRDISARYKQTVLGSAWAILQPLLLMLIFSFLTRIVRIETPKINGVPVPYPVFLFAGLIPWTMFSQGMAQSALSLVNNHHMMTKVYFPRLFMPISAACVFLVDVAYSLCLYSVILLLYRITPAWTVVFLPLLVLLTLIATLSIGVLLASLTLFYRDFRHVVPFLVQVMMWVSPIMWSASLAAERNPKMAYIASFVNPLFGIIDAYRGIILGTPLNFGCLLISATSAISLFIFAVFYFRRTERRFADYA